MSYGEGNSGGGGVFGTMALQNANNVTITGGSITGLTILETRELCFTNGSNANTVCFTTCVPAGNIDFVLPCAIGAVGSVLTDVAGNGTLTFEALGTLASQNANNVAITGGTISGVSLAGNLTLGENTGIFLDPVLSADGKYSATEALGSQTAGENLAFGEIVYLKASDSKWYKARANVASTSGSLLLGVCVLAGNTNATITVMLQGNVRADSLYPTLTIGGAVYLSVATAGQITATQPAANTDEVTRVLGQALTGDAFLFKPSPDHMTHV